MIAPMERLNVILKAFDGVPLDKKLVPERALKNLPLGACISICDTQEGLPELDAQEHTWLPAASFREGIFPVTDWTTIMPLDEELIERMRHYEAVFLDMVGRYAAKMDEFKIAGDIPYEERKKLYFRHLRYWNHLLLSKRINVVLMNHEPHQGYDYVLYGLCKLHGIPVFYLSRVFTVSSVFVAGDWEDPAPELRQSLEQVRKEYADSTKPVALSPRSEYFFETYRKEHPSLWYKWTKPPLTERSFVSRWWKQALKVLRRDPRRFLASILSSQFWSRKLTQHRAIHFYEQHSQMPDLSKPYAYFALHVQPEATTLPIAGAFVEQERIVELLAAHLPPSVGIYIKEHHAQSERCRSVEFYQSLLAIPSVTFVPRTLDTYSLTDHAKIIVTATGTVGFEAMMRLKPVLMFGHFLYQYAPGVFTVRTAEDCKLAVRAALEGPPITERGVRLFLKALERCATPFPGSPNTPSETTTDLEKAERVGALLERKIRAACA